MVRKGSSALPAKVKMGPRAPLALRDPRDPPARQVRKGRPASKGTKVPVVRWVPSAQSVLSGMSPQDR